jgi:hypothetical protein
VIVYEIYYHISSTSINAHEIIRTSKYFQKIGEDWIVHLEQLQQLKQFAKDANFQRAVQKVKQENKLKLAQLLQKDYGVKVNPASMFDIQVSTTVTYPKVHVKNAAALCFIIQLFLQITQFSYRKNA